MKWNVSVDERFFSKVHMTSGCWKWIAGKYRNGYGKFWTGERRALAHRFAYEQMVGPIPDGLDIDHLCGNRACVRPGHLEPVTRRTNLLRGQTRAAENTGKTHCLKGHPLSGKNLYTRPGTTYRGCRKCRAQQYRDYYRRNRAKEAARSRHRRREARQEAS